MCSSKEELYLKLQCAADRSKHTGRFSGEFMACLKELLEHIESGHEGTPCIDEAYETAGRNFGKATNLDSR